MGPMIEPRRFEPGGGFLGPLKGGGNLAGAAMDEGREE